MIRISLNGLGLAKWFGLTRSIGRLPQIAYAAVLSAADKTVIKQIHADISREASTTNGLCGRGASAEYCPESGEVNRHRMNSTLQSGHFWSKWILPHFPLPLTFEPSALVHVQHGRRRRLRRAALLNGGAHAARKGPEQGARGGAPPVVGRGIAGGHAEPSLLGGGVP